MELIASEVEAWLEGKEQLSFDDNDGMWSCSCPLAIYLQEKTGELWSVGIVSYWTGEDGGKPTVKDIPEWARKFVGAVDQIHGFQGFLTVPDALKAIRSI